MVLVVDDELDIRELLAELLAHDGLQVRTARTAEEAVSILGGPEPPDAIVVHLRTPFVAEGHALAAVGRRADLPPVPRVVVSGMRVPDHVAADPLNRVVRNPYDAAGLVAATREALKGSGRP